MAEQKIYKPRPITGFPEWLPEVRRVEQQWMDHIRKTFESYGFCSIETPSVEEIEVLSAKGEVDKEIYVLDRLHKDENEKSDARLALHFDQTVPLARYVAQHFNELDFPFKRYQMQKVWRGERPQAGRFREFYQCDIDVIGVDNVPIHFDGELAAIMVDILRGLNIGPFQMQISNRKILTGILNVICPAKILIPKIITLIDKKDKIGIDEFIRTLRFEFGLDLEFVQYLSSIIITKFTPQQFDDFQTKTMKSMTRGEPYSDMAINGMLELSTVMNQLAHYPEGQIIADLSIVRGLDYYTGTVYETKLLENPDFGSICSGGRYDDLAGNYINKHLPGVGISIGLSRLFDYMRINGGLGDLTRKCPTDILVCVPSTTDDTANILRKRGFNVEQYHSPQKIKKQMEYAVKKGIPYVWFPPTDEKPSHEVKNMITGEQIETNPTTWTKED